MGDTNPTTVNPSTLRDRYGPAPWWSERHLRELVTDHGLTADDIAHIWPVHPTTVREWINEYGIGEEAA